MSTDRKRRRSSFARYGAVLVAIWAILMPVWLVTRHSSAALTPASRGAELFRTRFTPAQGLGPLFNARSCGSCHGYPSAGGVGRNGLGTALRIGRIDHGHFDPMIGRGGPFARAHSISELGYSCALAPGIPAGANVSSVRNAPPLFGDGLIDAIPDSVILARATVEQRAGLGGRPNLIHGPGGRLLVGRFGWKADTPTVHGFVGQALRNELGVTNPLAPTDFAPPGSKPCAGESDRPDVGSQTVSELTAYVRSLAAPHPQGTNHAGSEIFGQAGCAACHTPTLQAGGLQVNLYSDLLLHDMGPKLDDHVVQGTAGGRDWRTAPLWGLHERTRFLHDGRATTLRAAILEHGGQAAAARQRFLALPAGRRELLLEFLHSL